MNELNLALVNSLHPQEELERLAIASEVFRRRLEYKYNNTHCTRANISDDRGLLEMLRRNIDYFQSKPVNLPKMTILLDHGYHPDHLTHELEKLYPQIMRKIKFELSTKYSKQEKEAQGKSGFVPAIARWVIERSNSWMERCKILVKNFERNLSNATTKLNLCIVFRKLRESDRVQYYRSYL